MARLITAAERMVKARKLIAKARKVAPPPELGHRDIHYIMEVKDILRDARDLIKFIPYSVGSTAEVKSEVAQIFAEIDQAEKELLHP